MAWALCWWLLGCGDPELRLDCEEPEKGDLDGYCVLGENDGVRAARDDAQACAATPSEPTEVAHGPGGCDAPSQAVLDAEQAAYEECWRAAYEAAAEGESGDTGCAG